MSTGPDFHGGMRKRRQGVTLIEVVVGLTILSLMSGAIYGIVSGAVESTATLAQIQTEDRRVEAFLDRARVAFAHLPTGAAIELKILESQPLRQELTIRGVGEAFVWGDRGGGKKGGATRAPFGWPEDPPPPLARADLRGKGGEPVSQR